MKQAPKNNVDPVLVDIKRPDLNYKHASKFSEVNLRRSSTTSLGGGNGFSFSSFITSFGMFLIIGVFLIAGFVFTNFQDTKTTVETHGQQAAQNFLQSIESFQNFEPGEANESLEDSQENLETINQSLFSGTNRVAFNMLSSVVPVFKEAGGFLKDMTTFNAKLIELSVIIEELKVNGFNYFRNNGEKIIESLNRSRDILRDLTSNISNLRNRSSNLSELSEFERFNQIIQDYHLNYSSNLYALEDFMGGLILLLSSEEEKRILLMFQNSSEIRPAGGFTGSYGELIVSDGQMQELVVEDIYWPDHEMNFDLKLIPPKPLQRITTDWGARDANWFFDFPTSAETVMTLLESSKIYETEGVRFEGAIAINIEVLESVMEAVGPIEIEEYDMEINHENFLAKLQEEVETGIDKQQGENPKKILSVLAPEIMNRLDDLSESDKAKLMEGFGTHVEDKDIMFYSRDNNINSFLSDAGVDGSIYDIPNDFWGSYLAVVNANVAGGKTDAFVDQSINVRVDVLSDGSVVSDLQVERTNNGDQRSEPWYNTENKNYIKVLTQPHSNLMLVEGNEDRGRNPVNYSSEYSYFKTLRPIEESRSFLESYGVWETREFGKKGFGAWLITSPGDTNTLSMRYESTKSQDFNLESGKEFEFVFDDQSGVDTSLSVEINAPVGFIWEESGSQVFAKTFDNPKGRETIELTIKEKE